MKRNVDVEFFIIGAGFAGLSVADKLRGRDFVVADRGEEFDAGAVHKALGTGELRQQICDFEAFVERQAQAMKSERPDGTLSFPLSIMSANVYSYKQGGNSNWWGGYAKRLTRDCFLQDGVLAWPFEIEELDSHYQEAEHLLRVHGDPERTDATVYGPMPGWQQWRDYLGDIFPDTHVTSGAKNVSDAGGTSGMGLCLGNGSCAICPNDAKARPQTVFPHVSVSNKTLVHELVFEGDRAVAARCSADGEPFEITFEHLILAAGGLENTALLRRSRVPDGVPRHLLGRCYQDHTAAELLVQMPKPIPYYAIGAECHVELKELSGVFNGIEVETIFLTVPPTPRQRLTSGAEQSSTLLDSINFSGAGRHLARIYLQMEIPPEWNLRLRTRGDAAYIYTMPYYQNLPVLDGAVHEIVRRIAEKGLRIERVLPHYRSGFGGHHYSGTTPMSRTPNAVVDANHLLMGTRNVYINGASVIPRCGSAGPTLTIVALGLRLGQFLAKA